VTERFFEQVMVAIEELSVTPEWRDCLVTAAEAALRHLPAEMMALAQDTRVRPGSSSGSPTTGGPARPDAPI
jgi:hypothetical protein